MTKSNLTKMTIDELVELFRKYALDQDQAMLYDEQAKVNRLVFKLKAVADELKSREGDQRSALLRLYDDRNSQVKVKAMKATLAVAPAQAIKRHPAALDAGMCLWAIEQGIFKPS